MKDAMKPGANVFDELDRSSRGTISPQCRCVSYTLQASSKLHTTGYSRIDSKVFWLLSLIDSLQIRA